MILKKDVTPQVKRSIEALHLGGIVWGELSSERLYADGDLMGALLGGVNDNGDGVAASSRSRTRRLPEPMAMKPTSVVMAAKRFPAP